MSTSVKKQARIADGRSHRCNVCPLRPCSDVQSKVCGDSFMEGFTKGVKFKQESRNERRINMKELIITATTEQEFREQAYEIASSVTTTDVLAEDWVILTEAE